MSHRAGAAIVAVAMVLGAAARAEAMSCIDHAYEHMSVELVHVRRGGAVVPAPPELEPLDELLNSGEGGKAVLFWKKETMGFAKFYRLDRADPPSPKVRPYIDAAGMRSLRTSCGYAARYTPILPGRYVFSEEHRDGAKTPRGIDAPVLTVSPGRGEVVLEFGARGARYEAIYRVKCALFNWDANRDETVCAPSEPNAALLAAPAPAPAPTTVDSTPIVIPSSTPSASAAPLSVASRELGPRSSCGACDAAGTSGGGGAFAVALAVGLTLAARRRASTREGNRKSGRSEGVSPARGAWTKSSDRD